MGIVPNPFGTGLENWIESGLKYELVTRSAVDRRPDESRDTGDTPSASAKLLPW